MKFENGLTRNFKINIRYLKFTLCAYFTYLIPTTKQNHAKTDQLKDGVS